MIRCASCGALIFFAPLRVTKRQIPLDGTPSTQGNVAIEEGVARILTLKERRQHASRGVPRYLPHWVTCEGDDP